MARIAVTNIAPGILYIVTCDSGYITYNGIDYNNGETFTGVADVETFTDNGTNTAVYEETVLGDFGLEIANPVELRYPENTKLSDFGIGYIGYMPEVASVINIKQYGNFFLMKEIEGVWTGIHSIQLNSEGNSEVTPIIPKDSIYTAPQLATLAESDDVMLVFAEDCGYTIAAEDERTNVAYVLVNTASGWKKIWSFDKLEL